MKINSKTKPVLLIDMDDVAVNFTGSAIDSIRKTPGIQFPQATYKFFENLDPMPGAVESINKLQEFYDVCILTRPSVRNPLCYSEKRVWIENYLGFDLCFNLILCYDKTMIKGDGINKIYLIDDNIHSGRFNPSWEHIHVGHGEFKNWEMVTDYLMKEIDNEQKTIEDVALEYISKTYYKINDLDELNGELLAVYNAIIFGYNIKNI